MTHPGQQDRRAGDRGRRVRRRRAAATGRQRRGRARGSGRSARRISTAAITAVPARSTAAKSTNSIGVVIDGRAGGLLDFVATVRSDLVWALLGRWSTGAVDNRAFGLSFPGMPNYTNSVWSETTPAPALSAAGRQRHCRRRDRGRRDHRDHRRAAAATRRAAGRGGRGAPHRQGRDRQEHRSPDGGARRSLSHADLALRLRGARLAAAGQRAAIERIALVRRRVPIACDFRRLPGYAVRRDGGRRARAGSARRRRSASSAWARR